jgi:hypothetical protein
VEITKWKFSSYGKLNKWKRRTAFFEDGRRFDAEILATLTTVAGVITSDL